METAKEIKDFLTTRRAKITPDQVGLPVVGRRRVPGLRREEVALLAGVSAEYYVQIERGQVAGVSEEVLHAIAGALRLDEVETAHLFDLAHAAGKAGRKQTRTPRRQVPEPLQALIDTMVTAPAIVQNGHLDIVAANPLGRALYGAVYEHQPEPPNLARFIFLADRAEETFPAWEKAADDAVALLRVAAPRRRTRRPSPTWSVNSPPAAPSSAPAGPRTTYGPTAAAPRTSGTPPSATSPCASKPSTRPVPPDSPSSATPPNPAHPRRRRFCCWRAGPPRSGPGRRWTSSLPAQLAWTDSTRNSRGRTSVAMVAALSMCTLASGSDSIAR